MLPYKCECMYTHIYTHSLNEFKQISSSQHALLLTVKGEYKCTNEVLFHVFLLIINIGGDLLMLYYFQVFLVCVSLWGHRSLEEQSLWSGWLLAEHQ